MVPMHAPSPTTPTNASCIHNSCLHSHTLSVYYTQLNTPQAAIQELSDVRALVARESAGSGRGSGSGAGAASGLSLLPLPPTSPNGSAGSMGRPPAVGSPGENGDCDFVRLCVLNCVLALLPTE